MGCSGPGAGGGAQPCPEPRYTYDDMTLQDRIRLADERRRMGSAAWMRDQPSCQQVTRSARFRAPGLAVRAITVHNPGPASCRVFVSGTNRISGVAVESSGTVEHVVPGGRTLDLALSGPDSDMAATEVTLSHGCDATLLAAVR